MTWEPKYLFVPITIPAVRPIGEIVAASDRWINWQLRPWWRRAIDAVKRVPEPPQVVGDELFALAIYRQEQYVNLALRTSLYGPHNGTITGITP